MKINNIDISEFNAQVVNFDASSLSIDNSINLIEGSITPIMGKQLLNASERVLIVDFVNEEDIGNFIVEISSFSLLNLDDGYQYKCYLIDTPSIVRDGYNAYTVSFNLYVLKQKEMQEVGFLFVNAGQVETEAIYEISSQEELSNVLVGEYIIKTLRANDVLVIDGIDKLIYYKSNPNISVIDDIEIYSFPKVKKRRNDIKMSEGVELVVKYYPTYAC